MVPVSAIYEPGGALAGLLRASMAGRLAGIQIDPFGSSSQPPVKSSREDKTSKRCSQHHLLPLPARRSRKNDDPGFE